MAVAGPIRDDEIVRFLVGGGSYADKAFVLITPSRGVKIVEDGQQVTRPLIHWRVAMAWADLKSPLNMARQYRIFNCGDEVGVSYNRLIGHVLRDPALSSCPFLVTLEDDMLPPEDALIRLLEDITTHPEYDAVSALYARKTLRAGAKVWHLMGDVTRAGDMCVPSNAEKMVAEPGLYPVNFIPQGCAVWRMGFFRDIGYPWCKTLQTTEAHVGQDVYMSAKGSVWGKRYAVDTRVVCGHLDVATDVVW